MLPRVSNLPFIWNKKAVNKLHEMSFLVYNPCYFSNDCRDFDCQQRLCSIFLGTRFQDARYAIAIMVFSDIFYRMDYYGNQILIPHNRNREFMLSTTIPAYF